MKSERIAIVGAGLMGHGIAQLFAAAGHPVSIYDPAPAALAAVPQRVEAIMRSLGLDVSPARGIALKESLEEVVEGAALVIEAAPEKLELKQGIFADLDRLTGPDVVLASNTSVIPIGRIAARAADRSRILGTHFWNPPHYVPLVEVVQTAETDPRHVDWTLRLMTDVGMSAVHVRKDVAGFIGNRLQHALKREAIALVAAGVCDAETLDDVVKYGFGSRLGVLGPMEQSDLVGLDLTRNIHETLMPDLDRTDRPHPFLVEQVEAGRLGMKTGEGFRKWTPESAEAVHRRLREALVAGIRRSPDDTRGEPGG